jgi:uncharacterized protein
MKESIKSKLCLKVDFSEDEEYKEYIYELISHEKVLSMREFIQHSNISCLEHSLCVSYRSYLLCKKLRLDYKSAARGGLLHDFFLYDWHTDKPYKGLHGFIHPKVALENVNRYFSFNRREKDIVEKHMWPLTVRLPRYKESFVVSLMDKVCALMEIMRMIRMNMEELNLEIESEMRCDV